MQKTVMLEKVVEALRSASSVEALDEVYIRAEGDLDDTNLD